MVNGKGQIAWSAAYRAYGNLAVVFVESVPQPLRFQGQYFDAESGLHYNRYRYYSPETARFITPDPIGLAGGLNQTQYVPNPTGWVDPLGLTSVPGGCPPNSDIPAGVKTGEPTAPSTDNKDVQWSPHGYKHSSPKNSSWKDIIKSTKLGPAKYKPGTDIEALERSVYSTGQVVTNGKPWKVKDLGEVIGASEGKLSQWMRVEESAGTIHGHPISRSEFLRLTKI
ncbi:RHS repeat-associated core domain-containing protein [Serratia sp. 2723]|uniref:RHS repeat-associated core domain-containing protein n=1 Tax=Serratia sp. 2723 TaxID=3373914 RepID=UPI003D1E9074